MEVNVNSVRSPPGIWEGQLLHLLSLIVFLPIVGMIWNLMDKPFPMVFWICIVIPISHQVFVWLSWRLELLSSSISKTIGFEFYLVVFFALFGGRFVSILWLAHLDEGSLNLPIYPRVFFTSIAVIPGLYALYSVKRYFGMARAAGADHFEEKYRSMPLVKEGIFRFTKNAMYVYAFLIFWAIALAYNSAAALLAVAFSHVYIWVLYYSTEKSDIEFIYGANHQNS